MAHSLSVRHWLRGVRPDVARVIERSASLVRGLQRHDAWPARWNARTAAAAIAQVARLVHNNVAQRSWALWPAVDGDVPAILVRVHHAGEWLRVDIEDRAHPNFVAGGWDFCVLPAGVVRASDDISAAWCLQLLHNEDMPDVHTLLRDARAAFYARTQACSLDLAREQAIWQGLRLIALQQTFCDARYPPINASCATGWPVRENDKRTPTPGAAL